MTLDDRRRLVDSLIAHEGLRLVPYADTGGAITIGVGRNLTAKGISPREAVLLLDHDIDDALAEALLFAWFPALDGVRQTVIVEMLFNLGGGGFRTFRKLIHAMAVGDYVRAAQEGRASRWASQVGSRAVTLMQQLESGL